MAKHYVTFGQVHTHRVDGKTLDCDTVAVYNSKNYKEGREKAFLHFGDKFFTSYQDEQWKENDQLKYFPKGYIYLNI